MKGANMAIKIITDSTAEYEIQELQAKNILVVPMAIQFNEKTYLDGVNLSKEEFFDYLIHTKDFPTTSQPSPEAFLKHFEEAKANNDEVIVILISSALSGTVQSAMIAKQMADYDKIFIIDSLTATVGIKMLVDKAVMMRHEGYNAEAITEVLESLKGKVKVYAAIDTLEYLCQGGRLSKVQAGIGTLAHLKPIVSLDETGVLNVVSKSIGLAKARGQIIKLLQQSALNSEYPLHLIYAYDKENCLKLKEKLEQNDIEVKDEAIYAIGPTIGTHSGPGTFGVVFVEA